MTKGQQRTPEELAEILSTYAITENLRETSRRTGIPLSTVKELVDKNRGTKEFEQLCTQKREEFSQRANRIVFKGLRLLERRYDKALDNEEELEALIDLITNSKDEISYKEKMDLAKKIGKLELNTLSEITTSMGTLFDKMRLSEDKSTENNKLEVNIKVIE